MYERGCDAHHHHPGVLGVSFGYNREKPLLSEVDLDVQVRFAPHLVSPCEPD